MTNTSEPDPSTEDTAPARPKLPRPVTVPTRDAAYDQPVSAYGHGRDQYVTTDDPEVASQYDARLWGPDVPGL
jgi:hypothetical protein